MVGQLRQRDTSQHGVLVMKWDWLQDLHVIWYLGVKYRKLIVKKLTDCDATGTVEAQVLFSNKFQSYNFLFPNKYSYFVRWMLGTVIIVQNFRFS